MRDGRAEKGLMALASGRVTAGLLAGSGEHNISSPELLKVMNFVKTQDDRQRILNNRFDKDMKFYTEGISAMKKEEAFENLMKYLDNVVNP